MKIINRSLILFLILISLFSCIESEYHWDNLNRKGVIDLPPVPLGAFETIVIKDLNGHIIDIPGIPSVTYEFKYAFRNLFGSSSIKRFFHEYVDRDISIQGELEVRILGEDSGLEIDIDFEPLNENNEIIKDVHIKGFKDVKYGTQDLFIIIPKENVAQMSKAEHLQMRITLTTPTNIELAEGDSIKLSKMIIKTAGYLVDL